MTDQITPDVPEDVNPAATTPDADTAEEFVDELVDGEAVGNPAEQASAQDDTDSEDEEIEEIVVRKAPPKRRVVKRIIEIIEEDEEDDEEELVARKAARKPVAVAPVETVKPIKTAKPLKHDLDDDYDEDDEDDEDDDWAPRARDDEDRGGPSKALVGSLIGGMVFLGIVVFALVGMLITKGTPSSGTTTQSSTTAKNEHMLGNIVAPHYLTNNFGLLSASIDQGPTEADATDPHLALFADLGDAGTTALVQGNKQQLDAWLKDSAVTLETRVIAVSDDQSTNKYSSRAANAFYCLVNYAPEFGYRYFEALAQNAPAKGAAGPTDDELVGLADTLKPYNGTEIGTCITKQEFKNFVAEYTSMVRSKPIPETGKNFSGVPWLAVDSVPLDYPNSSALKDPSVLAKAVEASAAKAK